MSSESPISGTGLTAIAATAQSHRVFYQLPDGRIEQNSSDWGVWLPDDLNVHPALLSPLATISWKQGQEVRVYYVGTDGVLSDSCFSTAKGWYQGNLRDMNIKVLAGSGLAALYYHRGDKDIIRVYYQDEKTRTIKEMVHENPGGWHSGSVSVPGTLPGTNLAAVAEPMGGEMEINIFYQAEDLWIREYRGNGREWSAGLFNSMGQAAGRSPVSAILYSGRRLQVYWRNPRSQVVFSRYAWAWRRAVAIEGISHGHQLAVLQFEDGKQLRLFYQSAEGSIYEHISHDNGNTWTRGSKLT